MLQKLRVHITPVGFEVDRVVMPLIKYDADKVYLVSQVEEKDDAREHIKEIIKRLERNNIKYSLLRGNIRDLYELLGQIKKIIDIEKNNLIYINVSSGGKISTIAGTMAAMMFKDKNNYIQPYYVEPENYNPKSGKLKIKLLSEGMKDVMLIPTFKVHLPDPNLMNVLKFIADKKKGRRKKEIVDFVFSTIFKDEHLEGSNRYMKVSRNITDKLLHEWDLIKVEGKGRSSIIKLSENGMDLIKFFQ